MFRFLLITVTTAQLLAILSAMRGDSLRVVNVLSIRSRLFLLSNINGLDVRLVSAIPLPVVSGRVVGSNVINLLRQIMCPLSFVANLCVAK